MARVLESRDRAGTGRDEMNRSRRALGGLLLVPALAAPALGQEPRCRQPESADERAVDPSDPWQQLAQICNGGYCFTQEETAGLIWCGKEVSFQETADAAAPILWFSPDEPLLKDANRATAAGLPEKFPWDNEGPECYGQSAGNGCLGRAYYLLSRTKGGTDPPSGDDQAPYDHKLVDLETLDGRSFYVSFLFFYNRDYGVNGHPVDLEGAEFRIGVARTRPEGSYRLNVMSIKGLAHGLNWAANRLQVSKAGGFTYPAEGLDTLFPLTLFVEEGKHASCPDRNGDGEYTPGYDVNSFVNDAWGVRDTFGTGVLGRRYDPTHTKKRRPEERSFPVPATAACLGPRASCAGGAETTACRSSCVRRIRYAERLDPSAAAGEPGVWPGLPRWAYAVRPACGPRGDCAPAEVRTAIIGEVAKTKNAPTPPAIDLLRGKVTRWKQISERIPLSYRAERGNGFSFTLPYALAMPSLGLMWAPKANATWGGGASRLRNFSVGVVASPSVSRWLDWYLFAGHQRLRSSATGDERRAFVSEYGLRVRLKPPGLDGNLPLLGLRIGIQSRGLHRPREPRLVIELGTGFL